MFSVSVESLTEVFRSFFKSSKYLYDCYFEFLIRHTAYIHFIYLIVIFVLFFHLEHTPLSPHFIQLSVFVSVYWGVSPVSKF